MRFALALTALTLVAGFSPADDAPKKFFLQPDGSVRGVEARVEKIETLEIPALKQEIADLKKEVAALKAPKTAVDRRFCPCGPCDCAGGGKCDCDQCVCKDCPTRPAKKPELPPAAKPATIAPTSVTTVERWLIKGRWTDVTVTRTQGQSTTVTTLTPGAPAGPATRTSGPQGAKTCGPGGCR